MQPNSWLIKTQNLQIAGFEKAYQQATDGLKNAPFSEVVQSASDLPFDAPADAKGAFWRGRIYLVADNIASPQDAREVVAHEMIGHYGLAGFFGNELLVVLDEIHENNPRVCIAFIFKTNPIIEASGIKAGSHRLFCVWSNGDICPEFSGRLYGSRTGFLRLVEWRFVAVFGGVFFRNVPPVSHGQKKGLAISRKALILLVATPGIEPGTSGL